MKHIDTIQLRNDLDEVTGLDGYDINYCIKKNLQNLAACLKPLAEMEEENRTCILKYTEEHKELQKKHATVLGEVKYRVVNKRQEFDIPESARAAYKADLKVLKEKYKDDLAAFEKKAEAYVKFLSETESDFVVTKIEGSKVPQNISGENFNRIWELIIH